MKQVGKTFKSVSISLLAFAGMVLLCGDASAAGWNQAATNIGDLGKTLVDSMVVLCGVGGVGAIGYAGKLLMKKSGERGEDVEWSKIGYATLAGAFLLSVSFIALNTVSTLGGDQSSIGAKINISR